MSHSITVLVVEDEPLIRMDIVHQLEVEGFRVLEAAHADQAIALLEGTGRSSPGSCIAAGHRSGSSSLPESGSWRSQACPTEACSFPSLIGTPRMRSPFENC